MKYFSNKLSHHGIKGQKWGVRRFQNADGSLTPAGKRRFSKLIELDEAHSKAVEEARKAADKEHRYVRSKGRGKGENYKIDAQDLYYEDENFRPIADKTTETWKKSRDLGEKYIKELTKVSNSNYNLLTVVGWGRAEQILNDYKDYKLKNN